MLFRATFIHGDLPTLGRTRQHAGSRYATRTTGAHATGRPEIEARHEHLAGRARLNPECQTHAVGLAMLLDGQGKDHKTMNRCTTPLMSANPHPAQRRQPWSPGSEPKHRRSSSRQTRR